MVRWGYTNTEGKIYGYLLLSEKPLTIDNLLELTNLSRTSISTSLSKLVRDYLVMANREKRVKHFSPIPRFAEKFMEQPKELLDREVIPLVEISGEIASKAPSDEYRNRMEMIKDNLENLKGMLVELIRIEEEKEL